MNEQSTSAAPHLRPWLWPRRKELLRRVDRIEAAVLIGVIAVASVLLPVALAVGSETYAGQARAGEQESRTRHPVTATLIDDAPASATGTRGTVVPRVSLVPARWTPPGGTERTGTVLADNGAKAGSPTRIWLDEAGNPVQAPADHYQAVTAGVIVAFGLWAGAAGALCGLYYLARTWLNRCRSARWQRDWARLEPGWTRGA
jgi:hypothetical protein